ncbi:MAG: hypothetical protein WBM99_08780 [Psychromonas sp.]
MAAFNAKKIALPQQGKIFWNPIFFGFAQAKHGFYLLPGGAL